MEENNSPIISVVVPIYNSALFLHRCIESLLMQTLENIEIICVNNGSTDNSGEILEQYRSQHPEKIVVVTIPHSPSIGTPRQVGIKHAKASYIGFCDSDDMMDLHALEYFYAEIEREGYDIVRGYPKVIYTDTNTTNSAWQIKQKTYEPLDIATSVLWVGVYKKELFKLAGPIPENRKLEDVAYTPILYSYAKKVKYIDKPVYYWYKRSGSESADITDVYVNCAIWAEKYLLENCNPELKYEMQIYVSKRMLHTVNNYWEYWTLYIPWIKEYWERLEENPFWNEDFWVYKKLKQFVELPEELIPTTLYINGFQSSPNNEWLNNLSQLSFTNEQVNIVILNEKNCNIDESKILRQAYENQNYTYIAHYFAMKNIYENGGIYLDTRISLSSPLNYVRYFNAFFCFKDKLNYSDWIWGGKAGDRHIAEMLKTYHNEYFYCDPYTPLCERIKNILTSVCNIPLEGTAYATTFPVAVFTPEMFLYPKALTQGKKHISSVEYRQCEECLTIPTSMLLYILTRSQKIQDKNRANNNELMKLKSKISELQQSESWKIGHTLVLLIKKLTWPIRAIFKK